MMKKGTVIGDAYIIKEPLGEGSSGSVFLAGKMEGTELFTVKSSRQKGILRQEADIYREIGSEYFPGFVDYIEEGDTAYLVLEYLEGVSLQKLLDKGRQFMEREILIIMEQVTAALSRLHYHKTPMVHLDIKPDNILITTAGNVRIIDLGTGAFVGMPQQQRGGTYGFGAPEQFWKGASPGPEADVYACGKLMAYLFTGKNPCKPPYDVEQQMLKSCCVKKCWRRLIAKCLELEPQKRYPDASMLHKEIMELQRNSSGSGKAMGKREFEVVYLKCIWKSDYERW